MTDHLLINQINQASEGLWWQSESDYPWQTVYWENVDDINSKLRELVNCALETKIEVQELDSFFEQVTEEQDWYNDEEMAECRRYQALVNLLTTCLTDVHVYRVGETEINVYVLGKVASGAIAGLSTISVET